MSAWAIFKRGFCLLRNVHTGLVPTQTSYPNGYWVPFPQLKGPGRDVDPLPPSSAKVKNERSYTSNRPYAFMAWIGK